MNTPRIMIAGSSGLVGKAVSQHFAELQTWDVVTISRRSSPSQKNLTHLAVDLTDDEACRRAFADAPPISHLLYTALHEEADLEAGWRSLGQQETNLRMLQNVVNGVERHGQLAHVTILQGLKAYGSHFGGTPVPAKERSPRIAHKIFYWQQEDFLRERARQGGWTFNILRPQLILGHALSSPMNIIAAIGIYASIKREAGEPLTYPGGGVFVTACTDSRLIARAVEFCATNSAVAGETFNVSNGDAITWQDMWPSIARHFNMPLGDHEPTRLSEVMPRKSSEWDAIVAKHHLMPMRMNEVVGSSWQYADVAFGYDQEHPHNRLMSPIKLRQSGFSDCIDTEDAVIYWLTRLQDDRILPL